MSQIIPTTARAGSALLAAALMTLAAGSASAQAPLKTMLMGAAEKPAPGDPDGMGDASLTIDLAKSQVCYDLKASGIAAATMAHIHKAPANAAGPVVVPLKPPVDGAVSACATADAALLKDISDNPGAYYVNVHNAQFPAGAIRGQLSR